LRRPLAAWVEHPDAGVPTPGYYLLGDLYAANTGSYAMILDVDGVPVWYTQAGTEGQGVSDVDDLVSGAVSYFIRIDDPKDASFTIEQLSPLTKTNIGPSGKVTDEHELRLLSNGNFLVISTPPQSVDLTGMMVPLPDGGVTTLSGTQSITACNLVEFQPDGSTVWSWMGTDHFDTVQDSVNPEFTTAGGTNIDAYHCNSIEVDTNGNLLVSARQLNSIFYIDKTTGNILWKMGGATYTKDNATYVSVADPFFGQHDARLQPGWSSTCNGGRGQISMFDDQTYGTGSARGIVYDVVVGAGDAGDAGSTGCDGGTLEGGTSSGTATVAWQHRGSALSAGTGSFRILPDDSRIIGWGILGGKPNIAFSVVDVNHNDMLDVYFDDGNITYRAIKVPLSTFDLDVLRSTAGL
jgi:arylsulfotransferase ASST